VGIKDRGTPPWRRWFGKAFGAQQASDRLSPRAQVASDRLDSPSLVGQLAYRVVARLTTIQLRLPLTLRPGERLRFVLCRSRVRFGHRPSSVLSDRPVDCNSRLTQT